MPALNTKIVRNKWYTRRERFYADAPQAEGGDHFQVYALNTRDFWKIKAGVVDGLDFWPVVGEIGEDWCEMVEVAEYFTDEGDGYFYYVGSASGSGLALRPSWREVRWVANFTHRFPDLRPSPEEVLMFQLTIGHWLTD